MKPNYRQGEVLILGEWINQKGSLKGLIKHKDNVIVEGEQSGHKHEVTNGQLFLFKKPGEEEKMVLDAKKDCTIKHPEHKPVNVKEGKYEIKLQRELDSNNKEQTKKVKD